MRRQKIEAALVVIKDLIRAGALTVVVETPEGSNCCPVVSANLNGNNIDVWLDEKFGNEINRTEERVERERIERFMAYLEREKPISGGSVGKYEYLTECYDLMHFGPTSSDGNRFLNMKAEAGWELVQMFSVPVIDGSVQLSSQCLLAVYRRPLPAEPVT